jgi:hypothetical protein
MVPKAMAGAKPASARCENFQDVRIFINQRSYFLDVLGFFEMCLGFLQAFMVHHHVTH